MISDIRHILWRITGGRGDTGGGLARTGVTDVLREGGPVSIFIPLCLCSYTVCEKRFVATSVTSVSLFFFFFGLGELEVERAVCLCQWSEVEDIKVPYERPFTRVPPHTNFDLFLQ